MQTVVELPHFSRRARPLLVEREISCLISYLAANPQAGDIIEGTGEFESYVGLVKAWGSAVAFA